MLYGVTSDDATTYLAVAAGRLVVVVISCLMPEIKARKVDLLTSIGAE
jgi:hypothetical protein